MNEVERIISTEPNHDYFTSSGFLCEIKRHPSLGHLCGYIYIPRGHPWYLVEDGNIDVDVHGGLTYSSMDKTIDFWCIGFDCSHYGDLTPSMMRLGMNDGEYRDWEYTKQEVERLAGQAFAIFPEVEVDLDDVWAKKYLTLGKPSNGRG